MPIMPDVEPPAPARVSAVILAHNRRDSIGVVLDKLAQLPREDAIDEVIVIDSGSTDGTADVVRARDDDVIVVDAGGNVAIAGRNIGARAATSEYVLFLDDDCYPLPSAVATLRASLDRTPAIGLVGGYVRDVGVDGHVV